MYRFLWMTSLLSALVALSGCENSPATPGGAPQLATDQSTPTLGNSDQGSPAAPPDAHTRMVQVLSEIGESAHKDSNKYFARAEAEQLRAELQGLPPGSNRMERFRLLALLGIRHLLMGENEDAIAQLSAAHALIPQLTFEPSNYPTRLHLLLGLAYLQKGEAENCVDLHTGESCLFPVRGTGVHAKPEGARGAIRYFAEVLERKPAAKMALTAQWLLNLSYMLVGEHPQEVPEEYLIPPERFESDTEFPRFREIATGLKLNTFSHSGGAVADDFDGDGWIDLMVSTWAPTGQIRYFANNGDGSFTDRTKESGLAGIYGGLNLIQGDYDNDGDSDVLVLRGAWLEEKGQYPNSLLRNDGSAKFRDVTFEVGLGDVHRPTQTGAWADFDLDGDLDLYIGNEHFPSQLFENDGTGNFRDVATLAGVTNDRKAKAAVWGDYNDDRYPDLYVSNQGHPNRLYRNNGDGTFTDVALRSGVFEPIGGFPAWFWDYNNDGALDLMAFSYEAMVSDLAADYLGLEHEAEPDRLYKGDGKGGFVEVGGKLNLRHPTAPMGSNFGDLDNDGFPDFYLGTGYPEYEQLMPNLMFHNRRGTRFDNVTTAGGFGHLQKGHGVAFADFDHDGDQDVFIEMGGAYAGDAFWNAFFENPGFGNHWITLKLVGTQSNRAGIGARIRVEVREDGQTRSIYKWVNSGGSFGGNPLRQQIGLGTAEQISVLEVYWPASDTTDTYRDLSVDQFLEITEGNPAPRQLDWQSTSFSP